MNKQGDKQINKQMKLRVYKGRKEGGKERVCKSHNMYIDVHSYLHYMNYKHNHTLHNFLSPQINSSEATHTQYNINLLIY